ncbi:MAG: UDP-N-acetylmuramoyl-L-alanine--D-glutamate ligase [Pseudomonadota bacterium]
MITITGIKGQKIGVFGLGATGLAAADALIASGAEVYSWDENPASREKTLNTEYRAEEPDNWPWSELSSLVLSPGVPLTHPTVHPVVRRARAEGVEIIGDLELFARTINGLDPEQRPCIVAITGSNGKSTTTRLITHILRETGHLVQEGGNIGKAVLDLPNPDENAIYVLELSSFQLDLVSSLRANIAVFLNISPDHLDRHGGMDGYVAAKRRIFRNQTKEDHAIIGVDDEVSQSVCTDLTGAGCVTVTPISAQGTLGGGVFALADTLFYNLDHKTSKAGLIPAIPALRGRHNYQNAAAALAVCCRLGVSPPVAMLAMGRFKGLAHRMEKVADLGAMTLVNDSKATNANAAAQALTAYKDIFWLAGGKAKDGGLSGLTDTGAGYLDHVRAGYFFGQAADMFSAQIGDAVPTRIFGTMERALMQAVRDARASGVKNPVILLSPAAASYDQFTNFEERGNAFRALVDRLVMAGPAAGDDLALPAPKTNGEAA